VHQPEHGPDSSLNIANYLTGKLNGATARVLPNWPPAPANVSSWAASTTTQGWTTITEGQTLSSPNDSVTAVQVAFGATVNALTLSNSAVTGLTIVSTGGTSYSSLISSATLDATCTVLTVKLSSALPKSQTYVFALNPTITATQGGPVQGVKSVKVIIGS
jgi:hypothetical protein